MRHWIKPMLVIIYLMFMAFPLLFQCYKIVMEAIT